MLLAPLTAPAACPMNADMEKTRAETVATSALMRRALVDASRISTPQCVKAVQEDRKMFDDAVVGISNGAFQRMAPDAALREMRNACIVIERLQSHLPRVCKA
ncbi:hypothetical protein HK414_08085 [Ramlibacter terrae]|uniref:UrcA family protein n=1 Tax=Ramlibacter terrae TaxID=2732511 RepID=A0ABX6P1G1_9BURK|nr:hypothetical protein HK414_08085 [Ramlibacter terrae]